MRFNPIEKFKKAEHGGLSVEAVLAVPMLVWVILATFVFWDGFRTINVAQKATFTVADMLSRETVEIDNNYLTAVHETFDYLAGETGGNALRVTVVTKIQDPVTNIEEMQLVWSEGVGGLSGYDDLTILQNRLPDIAVGDQMLVGESEQTWAPAFT
ncbi:MAG: hypothetical protein OXQ30_04800, partial [Boseongicola sp.]|nr:hypothetical protein [Boseongicola sp.]